MSIRKTAMLLLTVLLFSCMTSIAASGTITEPGLSKEYQIIVDDEADLLSAEEESRLVDDMKPLSRYGTVVFWTTRQSGYNSETKARDYIRKNVSDSIRFSSTMFLIDMGSRQLQILSFGKLLNIVTVSNAYSITNNVSGKATAERYYDCASEAFSQMRALAQGRALFVPMRYICSALLALAVALLAAYLIVRKNSVQPMAANYDAAAKSDVKVEVLKESLVSQEKTARSSGSSCGGGSGCGGGGGGGSSCGGGGSSGF